MGQRQEDSWHLLASQASQSGNSEVSGKPGRAKGMAQQLEAKTALVERPVNSTLNHLLFPATKARQRWQLVSVSTCKPVLSSSRDSGGPG